MKPAADAFAELLLGADFLDARFPVLQNTDPVPTTDAETIRKRLVAQITAPVRWTETMQHLVAEGPITLIESGPGAVLTGLSKRVDDVTGIAVESMPLEQLVAEVS